MTAPFLRLSAKHLVSACSPRPTEPRLYALVQVHGLRSSNAGSVRVDDSDFVRLSQLVESFKSESPSEHRRTLRSHCSLHCRSPRTRVEVGYVCLYEGSVEGCSSCGNARRKESQERTWRMRRTGGEPPFVLLTMEYRHGEGRYRNEVRECES